MQYFSTCSLNGIHSAASGIQFVRANKLKVITIFFIFVIAFWNKKRTAEAVRAINNQFDYLLSR